MIMRINPDMLPVLTAGVDVDEMDALELSEYVENELIPSLESVEGVASVSATGLLEEKITVTLSQSKIDKLNEKVKESIEKQFKEHEKELEDAVSEELDSDDGKTFFLDCPLELIEFLTAEKELAVAARIMLAPAAPPVFSNMHILDI